MLTVIRPDAIVCDVAHCSIIARLTGCNVRDERLSIPTETKETVTQQRLFMVRHVHRNLTHTHTQITGDLRVDRAVIASLPALIEDEVMLYYVASTCPDRESKFIVYDH